MNDVDVVRRRPQVLGALVIGALLASAPAARAACVPNGDDAGCFTTNPTYSSCEQRATKNASKLLQSLLKCHVRAAAAAAKGTMFAEEVCESSAKLKFENTTRDDDCPCVYPAGIADDVEKVVDQDLAGSLFCMEACPAGAASVGGSCWVRGAPGEDCDTACGAIGETCDPATITFAGSGGTDANCSAVSHAVDSLSGAITAPDCSAGLGCVTAGGVLVRCEAPVTTCAASQAGGERYCGCH